MKSYHKIVATLAAAAFSLTLFAGDASAMTTSRHHLKKTSVTSKKKVKGTSAKRLHRVKKSTPGY
ncbi:MAG TPA: hypothetical protein VER58_16780 [Thermoanaerobaculia bacterium]|nr:hypothetical protein [Thermoanaerobaculia bacterium]